MIFYLWLNLIPQEVLKSREEFWQYPMTGIPLITQEDIFYAEQVGISYPAIRGTSSLRAERGVVASKIIES